MEFIRGEMGKGWCDVDLNELVFTLGGSHRANFGENRSRNATVRVSRDNTH